VGILLKFVSGAYQGDMSHAGDAMSLLADIYGKLGTAPEPALLDTAITVHAVLQSRDAGLSSHAGKILNKLLCTTKAESIS
jgi:hypothetical protein